MPRRRVPVPPAPLPQRDGLDPVHLRLPRDGGPWTTVRDHLAARLSGAPPGAVDTMLRDGAVVTADGRPVTAADPFVPGLHLWFHRAPAPEVPVPFTLRIVHRDAAVLVADKPHFLATTPRGRHATETALARLRRETGSAALAPAHRLDRLTAGLVLFTVDPALRGAYQNLFRDRVVRKEYEAVAPYRPEIAAALPATVRTRIVKTRGVPTARAAPGPPNAETRVDLLERRGGLARYRLLPRTGRTHQLRVHMSGLGLPILGDPLYPETTDVPPDDFRRPLQLLARTLEFPDPVTGAWRRFTSERALGAWDDPEGWAAGR